ncbi:MAG TPA: HAMP domain-containing sensor histidine kinase [Acidimicrobiia bacterium]|nr:HAMP domain-containing sensor histidine kinase [Acidimicrobiia bacterium]
MTEDAALERPRSWWPRTVRMRITLVATLVFAIALSAAAFGLVRVVHNNLSDTIKSSAQRELDQLDPSNIQPAPGDTEYLVVNGRIVGTVRRGPSPQDYYEARRRFETAAGPVVVVATRSLAEVDSTTNKVTDLMLIVVPILVALVAAAAWYLAGRALKPVEAIRAEAEAITGSTIHRRVPEPDTDDEVGRLAHTMNAMLGRLELSSQRQRQFVSDASHELRSPLASIRTNVEVALRNGERTDWPSTARRVLAEDERMEDTVSELLELARVDELDGSTPITSLPEVDLDEVVLDATVREHRVLINTNRVSAGRVHGRREQLARVVRNLLDNADRHARTMVAVELHNDDDSGAVELVVDDDGPGISPEDRERVFDRFTRLDDGRARDAGGLGLGLSMVKSIVEQHGGTVTIGDAPIGGARVAVRLPAA